MSITGELSTKKPERNLQAMMMDGRLTESAKRPAFDFDPSREISEEDWREFAEAAEQARTFVNIHSPRSENADLEFNCYLNLARILANCNFLAPEKDKVRRSFQIFQNQDWDRFEKGLQEYRTLHTYEEVSNMLFYISTISPEKAADLLHEADWQNFEHQLHGYLSTYPLIKGHTVRMFARLLIIFPERTKEMIRRLLSETNLAGQEDVLFINWLDKVNLWNANCLPVVQLLSPQRFKSLLANLDTERLMNSFKREQKNAREDSNYDILAASFASQLALSRLLAAQEEYKADEPAPPRPERKKL